MGTEEKTHKLLCIVCPEGCEMDIKARGEDFFFSEGICKRGQEYARQEITAPSRVLTTTVPLLDSVIAMLPVRTLKPIPKRKLIEAMDEIAQITARAPVFVGEEVLNNVAGTGIPLIATRDAPLEFGRAPLPGSNG
jgi:CxxC motif-containing protein